MIGLGGDWLVPPVPRQFDDPAWRYREIATSHMVPSNRPGDLVRVLLELT